jgi:hypothetical protein
VYKQDEQNGADDARRGKGSHDHCNTSCNAGGGRGRRDRSLVLVD